MPRRKSIRLQWRHANLREKSKRRCSSSGGQTGPFRSSALLEAVRRCRGRSSRNSHDQSASLRWVRVHRQTMSKELLLREGSGAWRHLVAERKRSCSSIVERDQEDGLRLKTTGRIESS